MKTGKYIAEQTQEKTEIHIEQNFLNDNLSLFLNTLRPTNLIYTLRTSDNQYFAPYTGNYVHR